MSENDEKKAPESLAPRASALPPSPTRPPPPSERRNTSMPPPPPRRSVKPSGPPPPPPRPPKGQRLAGVFSTPPPPVDAAPAPLPVAPEPIPAPVVEAPIVEAPIAVAPPPEPTPAPVAEPTAAPAFVPPPEPSRPVASEPIAAPLPEPSPVEPPVAVPSIPAPSFDPTASVAPAYTAEAEQAAFVPAPVVMSAPVAPSYSPPPSFAPAAGAAPLSARLAAAQERFVRSIPPPWIELARRQPVLWMVVTPLVLATLLILIAVALAPDVVETARPEPLTRSEAPASTAKTAEAAPTPAAAAGPDSATIASLEAKSSDSLTVEEVLRIKQYHAVQKRKDAQSLADQLLQESAKLKDPAVQRELLQLATDPDTSELMLTSLARLVSPVAKDLLFEVSTGRTVPPATAELAAALLSSREVRGSASPALLIALDLRGAASCEAVQAALPQAKSEGDRRSLPSLGKLNSRRGCGADKSEDCYPCLRSQMKDVTATINAVKKRKAPSLGVD